MLLFRPMPDRCQESLKGWLERLINAYVLRYNTATHADTNNMYGKTMVTAFTTTTHHRQIAEVTSLTLHNVAILTIRKLYVNPVSSPGHPASARVLK